MHRYRTHTCGGLRQKHAGVTARLSGWVHRKRDHGGLLFIDLRDHYGITQLVFTPDATCYQQAAALSRESVVTVTGRVVERAAHTVNPQMPTSQVELRAEQLELLSAAADLPFAVAEELPVFENTRLTYRFLYLRRQGLHQRIALRSQVIASIRRRLCEMGFSEYQTPILTSTSPEGARDFLVPSRLHPGEFYQLDLEMAFVEQEDVFQVIEDLFAGLFAEFGVWEAAPPPPTRASPTPKPCAATAPTNPTCALAWK